MAAFTLLFPDFAEPIEVNQISFSDALRWLKSADKDTELRDLVVLPERSNRNEPRVRKRRPKNYKLMKQDLAAQ